MKLIQVLVNITFILFLLAKDSNNKCNDFFTYDDNTKICTLNEVIHNKKYLMKFDLNELTYSSTESCQRDNKKNCNNNKLIGPIISSNSEKGNSLFFISLLEQKTFSLTDYSYKVSNDTKLSGHLFALFPYTDKNKDQDQAQAEGNNENKPLPFSNSSIVLNIKLFRNLGSELSEVKILPGMHYHTIPIQNAIILKYINGDTCSNDNTRNNSAYLIINCDSTGGFYMSPQLKFISEDKCTFVFEWNNRFGCPACLKQDLVPILEGCFNKFKRAHYFENLNCVIPKENISTISTGNNTTDNITEYYNDDNILYYDNTDKIVLHYLQLKYDLTDEQLKKDFTRFNITYNNTLVNEANKDIYVETRIQQVPCMKAEGTLINSYSEGVIIGAICIAYIILITCLVYLFCQYQRVSKDYMRLKQTENSMSTDQFPNTQIELTNI